MQAGTSFHCSKRNVKDKVIEPEPVKQNKCHFTCGEAILPRRSIASPAASSPFHENTHSMLQIKYIKNDNQKTARMKYQSRSRMTTTNASKRIVALERFQKIDIILLCIAGPSNR